MANKPNGTLYILGVINNLKKRVRVAGVPSVDTNRALISSRFYQSMCFDKLINLRTSGGCVTVYTYAVEVLGRNLGRLLKSEK